jgi:16S rRNA (guanine527-N7)-methyltransferase
MSMEATPAHLEPLWQELGWHPGAAQLAQLVALQEQLRHWNGRLNLTRLVEGDDYWLAQVFDSLWPLRALLAAEAEGGDAGAPQAPPLAVIDVGTGGGFPGLAVAIALPTARLTLVDSVGRKVEAVRAMAAALGLAERVTVRCERIEQSGRSRELRGRFDWALARAVASAPVVAEYLVPLLRSSGRALLYRGQWSSEDQSDLERAAALLRARIERLERRELPAGRGVRHALVLLPTAPCPAAYPRAVGVPARQPLGVETET